MKRQAFIWVTPKENAELHKVAENQPSLSIPIKEFERILGTTDGRCALIASESHHDREVEVRVIGVHDA